MREEEAQKRRDAHRQEGEERRKEAVAKHEKAAKDADARREQRLEHRAANDSTRPPDPNRPPPDQLKLELGPAVVPDPSAGKPQ